MNAETILRELLESGGDFLKAEADLIRAAQVDQLQRNIPGRFLQVLLRKRNKAHDRYIMATADAARFLAHPADGKQGGAGK